MRISIVDVAERLSGEWLMGKNTGGRRQPSPDQVSRLAYAFYERRGRVDGHELEDWLQAEAELARQV